MEGLYRTKKGDERKGRMSCQNASTLKKLQNKNNCQPQNAAGSYSLNQ